MEAGSSRPRRRQIQCPAGSSSWLVDGHLLAVSSRGGQQKRALSCVSLSGPGPTLGTPRSEPHHLPRAPPPATVARGSAFDVCIWGNANGQPTTGSLTTVLMSRFSRSRYSIGTCAEPVTSFPADASSSTTEPTLPITALSPRGHLVWAGTPLSQKNKRERKSRGDAPGRV